MPQEKLGNYAACAWVEDKQSPVPSSRLRQSSLPPWPWTGKSKDWEKKKELVRASLCHGFIRRRPEELVVPAERTRKAYLRPRHAILTCFS